jgi:hypothetical protein
VALSYRKLVKRNKIISKAASATVFDITQDLASAECMIEILKNLLKQVVAKEIYPHELGNWIKKFEASGEFEGTHEELVEALGLVNFKTDYDSIREATVIRVGKKVRDLEITLELNNDVKS